MRRKRYKHFNRETLLAIALEYAKNPVLWFISLSVIITHANYFLPDSVIRFLSEWGTIFTKILDQFFGK